MPIISLGVVRSEIPRRAYRWGASTVHYLSALKTFLAIFTKKIAGSYGKDVETDIGSGNSILSNNP